MKGIIKLLFGFIHSCMRLWYAFYGCSEIEQFFDNDKRLQLGVKRFQVVLGKRSENRLENLTV